jgi:hypothetical protein
MSMVLDPALETLREPGDVTEVAAAAAAVNSWSSASYSNPLMATLQQSGPGSVACAIMSSCTYTAFASLMHHTAMQQLHGERPIGDWQPVMQVRQCRCYVTTLPAR